MMLGFYAMARAQSESWSGRQHFQYKDVVQGPLDLRQPLSLLRGGCGPSGEQQRMDSSG